MKTPYEYLNRAAILAIPPPAQENEPISKELSKQFIAAIKERMNNGDISLSYIACDLKKLAQVESCDELERKGILGFMLYVIYFQFGTDKITIECLRSAIAETQLHFCAKPQLLMEFRAKKESIELTMALKKLLINSLQGALLHQVISYEDLMESLIHIGSYTDLEEAANNCALMEELLIICDEFMEEFNDMEAINIALAGLALGTLSLRPMA